MAFLKLARERYSCRNFNSTPIEPEKLARILEAGQVAPTACNRQPQRILVIQSPQGLAKLEKCYKSFGARAALLVCADHSQSWRRPYDGFDSAEIDVSIVTDHMMLCAADEGLRSVWVCAFPPSTVREEFDLPADWEPVNLLFLGYSDEEPPSIRRHTATRNPLEDTVFYESFDRK